jgi:hypothetical protein
MNDKRIQASVAEALDAYPVLRGCTQRELGALLVEAVETTPEDKQFIEAIRAVLKATPA